MPKNKKIIITLIVISFIGIMLFFLRENNAEKEVWLIATFQGDTVDNFNEDLLKIVQESLTPSSQIILEKSEGKINDIKQAKKELKTLKAKAIIWGRIEDKKIILHLTASAPTSRYITINNSMVSLLNLRNVEFEEDLQNFTEDNASIIKTFIRGYIKYLDGEYNVAISIWENKFPADSLMSFYLGNAYLMLSQKGEQVKINHLKAREYYRNLLPLIDKNGKLVFYQSVLNNSGLEYFDYPFDLYKENLTTAQNFIKEAVKMSPDWENEEYGTILNNLAVVYENIYYAEEGKFNKLVTNNLSEAIRVFRKRNNNEMRAVAENNLAISSIKRKRDAGGDIEETINNLNSAKRLISKTFRPEIFYSIANNLGVAYSYKKDTKEALKYFDISRQFFSQNNYPKETAFLYKNMGILSLLSTGGGNLTTAREYFQKALEFFKEDEYPIQFGIIQETLGDILTSMPQTADGKNILEAIGCFENALRVIKHDNLPTNFAQISSNLGLIYSSRKDNNKSDNLKKSIFYYGNCLLVYKKEQYPFQYANIKNNLGNIARDLSQSDEKISQKEMSDLLESAITYFGEALEIYQNMGLTKELIMTKVNLANTLILFPQGKKNNLNKAISIYQDVLSSPEAKNYYDAVQHNMEMAKTTLLILEK